MKINELLKIIILLMLFASFSKEACPDNVTLKPAAPFWITISPLNKDVELLDIQSNSAVDFIVTTGTYANSMNITLTITATGGIDIIGGMQKWSGAIMKNSTKTVSITVRTSKTGRGKITARVEPTAGEDPSFRAVAHYDFYRGQKKEQAPVSRKAKDRQGREIIEYEVK